MFLYKGVNPTHQGETFMTYSLPKGPPSQYRHIRKALTYDFGEGNKLSVYSNIPKWRNELHKF